MSQEVRARASDWLQLGPIVGFTSDRQSRLLAQPLDGDDPAQLELRIVAAGPGPRFDPRRRGFWPLTTVGAPRRLAPTRTGDFRTAVFELDELEPGTRYLYEIVPRTAATEHAGLFASAQPSAFATLGEDPACLKFALLSCNGLHHPPKRRRPTTMWARLLREAVEDPDLHLAILAGDQVYADVIREEWQREWEPDFDPYDPELVERDDAIRCREFFEDLPRRFEQIYRAFWRRPEIRDFMGHVPCVMTWDDHDIYDGWGSHGDEQLSAQQVFFRAAARAFDAFALALAPPRPLSPAAAAQRLGHRAFSFMLGKLAVVVLDLRSQRNIKARGPSAVLGETQWAWLSAELAEIARRGAEQIVVVSAIPLVHIGALVEHLIPSDAELHDDALDHWISRPNRSDQARLIGKLFQVRKETGANVLILGGDVHVATVGAIVSDDRRFLLDGEGRAQLHQGVSSAIAHGSLAGIAANVVRWLVQREHPLRGGFVGRIDEVIAERNFAVVDAQSNRAFRFTIFHEGSTVPEQFYFARSGG